MSGYPYTVVGDAMMVTQDGVTIDQVRHQVLAAVEGKTGTDRLEAIHAKLQEMQNVSQITSGYITEGTEPYTVKIEIGDENFTFTA